MSLLILMVLGIVLVLAQTVFPQTPWYHHGTYAGLLIGLLGAQWWLVRRQPKFTLALCGATLIAVAGLASSLLAPDTQTIVAGAGQNVALSEPSGTLGFPVSQPPAAPVLHRPGRADVVIGPDGRTYLAGYVLWTQPRTAAYIEAFDARGAHLTLTQPQSTSAAFLSPVLLFSESKAFQDQNLPVDSFALPAVHRSVNAVLFASDVVAKMQKLSNDPRPGILFAVSDDRGRTLPEGLGLARSGDTVALGGVRLRPVIEDFPTVVIASAPYLPVVGIGLLLFCAGLFKNRFR